METPIAESAASPARSALRLESLPGPRPWPLIGNLAQIDPLRMHARLEQWAEEYGPMYRLRLGRREALVVAHAELIAGLLRDRPDGWRRLRAMQTVIAEMGAHGVFSAEGDDWRRQRRLVLSAFDPGHLKRYFPSLVRVTERLRQRLEDAVEALIAARDDEGSGLSEQDLVGNVLTVLLPGEDTTANTLGWTLHLLHTHRGAWDELVTRVDAALGDDDLPRHFDVARGFEAIEHAVNEAMRLHPVAPLLLMESNEDTVLGGVPLRRGSMVICLTRSGAVNRALEADAAEFRPQRWREAPGPVSNGAPAGEAAHSLLKASMPFGAGPRLCPGRYLAMLEMKMVLATLARNFELVQVSTQDGSPPQERLAFTMFAMGLKMRLALRGSH